MLNRKNIILFFIFFTFLIQAQDKNDYCEQWRKQVDTTQNLDIQIELSKKIINNVDDLCKLKIYQTIAWILYKNKRKIDSSLHFYDKAIVLAENLKSTEFLSKLYSEKGYIYTQTLKNKYAITWLKKARKIIDKDPDNKTWIIYYESYAEMADSNADYNKAIQYTDSMIYVSEKINDSISLANCYHNKGLYYFRLSNYEEAARVLLQSIELKEKQVKSIGKERTYYLLGYNYLRREQFQTAKKYFKKGINLAKEKSDNYTLLLSYPYLAECYRKLGENNKALSTIDLGLKLAEKLNNSDRIARAASEKGWLYLKNFKEYDEAEKYFLKAYKAAKISNDNVYLQPGLFGLVDVYLHQGKFNKAKRYLKPLEEVTKNLNILHHTQQFYKISSEYYSKTNQSTLAFKHLQQYHTIKDSISNQQVQTQVANLEKKYDTEKKELEIIKLNQEKEKQEKLTAEANLRQNLFLGFSILLALLLAFGSWVFLKLRKQQQQLTEAHHNLTEINQVKNRLFSIIAHDLRGMLLPFQRSGKILKYHIDKGNYERTIALSQELQKNSESLSTMLDNLLSWSLEQMNGYRLHPEQLSVANQLQEIVQGFEQQAIHKNTKIDIKYNTDVSIQFDKGAFHVIFRNLIGNALKYTEKGSIRIEFKKDFNTLVCSVSDTGIGMTKEQLQHIFTLEDNKTTLGTQGEKGTGLGLNLVYRFVKMHKGIIKVSSEKRIGTRFDLSLPITESLNKQTEGIEPLSA